MAFLTQFCVRLRYIVIVGVLLGKVLGAQANTLDEETFKASLLRNFIEFVIWPSASNDLAICHIGQRSPGQSFTTLAGRSVNGRVLIIRQIEKPNAISGCDAVYVPASEQGQLDTLLLQTRGKPILVVADSEGAAQLGATVSLHDLPGGRVGFDINVSESRAAGLKISSRLIQLARRVH